MGTLIGGVRQGQGKYIWTDGDHYDGEWYNDKRHGWGKMTWAKGGAWEGEYREDDYWKGERTMHFTDGTSCHVVTRRGEHR